MRRAMYKDKEKQKTTERERQRRYRKGVTNFPGLIPKGVTEDLGVTDYPDIIDKLTDPVWRSKLEKICHSFHRRSDMEVCWLGDTNLTTVCDWLECTA